MKNAAMALVAIALIASPAQAEDWAGVRPGTFVGARLTVGGKNGAQPVASFTVAPTHSRLSHDGMMTTRIGEGFALNFSPRHKPTLTLAGIRADTALGLRRNGDVDAEKKHGVSDGGWVAIGLGAAAIIAGGLYLAADHIADCDEGECD